MRSDLKYITDILKKLITGNHVKDIIDEWKQLKEMYKVRHGVRDVIDIGEQLLARYEEWSHVSLYKLDQWIKECGGSCLIVDIWKQLMKECTKWTGVKDIVDKWKQLIGTNYHVRSDLKYITDILKKLIIGNHVKDIIDEWKQLKEMYKMRHGVVGDVIDIGEQLLARYEEWCHVSLYKMDQWVKECKASCGIVDIWEQLMKEFTKWTGVKDIINKWN